VCVCVCVCVRVCVSVCVRVCSHPAPSGLNRPLWAFAQRERAEKEESEVCNLRESRERHLGFVVLEPLGHRHQAGSSPSFILVASHSPPPYALSHFANRSQVTSAVGWGRDRHLVLAWSDRDGSASMARPLVEYGADASFQNSSGPLPCPCGLGRVSSRSSLNGLPLFAFLGLGRAVVGNNDLLRPSGPSVGYLCFGQHGTMITSGPVPGSVSFWV